MNPETTLILARIHQRELLDEARRGRLAASVGRPAGPGAGIGRAGRIHRSLGRVTAAAWQHVVRSLATGFRRASGQV